MTRQPGPGHAVEVQGGALSGTLIVGDVHGCSRELRLLLRRTQPTRVILAGDLFTRGPDPAGVWKLIRRWNAEAVLGNQDLAVLESWKPKLQLPRKAFRWLRRRPFLIHGAGWTVAHAGVNPFRPDRTRPREAVSIFKVRGPKGRRVPWWKLYRGDRLIVHGHHRTGRVRDNRPRVLGLDTGCVAGGELTGFLLERGELVSVPSRRRRKHKSW